MSENNQNKYLRSFAEGLREPLVDLLIEILAYLFTIINTTLQQLSPSSHYAEQFTYLSTLLVAIPLLLILISAFIKPLIDWLDALFYGIGLILGFVILTRVNFRLSVIFS